MGIKKERLTGFSKLYVSLPALRMTWKECYRKMSGMRSDMFNNILREDGRDAERCISLRCRVRKAIPLTGAPGAPPGIEISMTLFGGKLYTLPAGRSSCAVFAPLRIWRRTGAVGGMNG
jgi:hypothetical protein